MNDRAQLLMACFQSVFSNLDVANIQDSSRESIDEWDSLATVRLVAVIEEQFGLEIDLADVERLDSFRAIAGYLEDRLNDSGGLTD